MQTIQLDRHLNENCHPSSPRRFFAALRVCVMLASLGLAGCAQIKPQRVDTDAKPGTGAPHEERNPSQHPEQFRQ